MNNFNPKEIAFLTKYYLTKLEIYEQFDYKNCSKDELFKLASRASSLRKMLLDFIEEEYTEFIKELVQKTDAINRLGQILEIALKQLGGGTERDYFYLYPKPIHIKALEEGNFGYGKYFELSEYLDLLDKRSENTINIASCFENAVQMQHWKEKTKILMLEMVDFLFWIVAQLQQHPKSVPVPLLRDTLLIYYGLVFLNRNGASVCHPKPIFISRKFIKTYFGSEDIYLTLSSELLYDILYDKNKCSLNTLRQEFATHAYINEKIPKSFIELSSNYMDSLNLEGSPILIETGLHGTFPLWLLTINKNIGNFVLYNTVPWLYSTYQDIVFRKNCNYLRDIETIVLHDHLIQFKEYQDNGQVIIEETNNPSIKALALFELHLFKKLLKERMNQFI